MLLTEEAEFATWLTGSPEEAFGVLQVSDPDRMQIVQSGFDKELLGPGIESAALPPTGGPEGQQSFFDKMV